MDTGSTLIYLGILSGILSIFSLVARELKGIGKGIFLERLIPHAGNLIRISVGFITLASGLLIYFLINSDFSIHYVWQYTSRDLPLVYKLSAFWTGQEGSLLFLSWVIFVMVLWLSERHGSEGSFHRRVQVIVLITGMVFLSISAILSPFMTSYDAGLAEVPEDGAGLNPILVNKWMIFHPPGIFVPYGILVVVFASALVHLFSGNRKWEEFSRPYGRIAWIILGAGIVTGDMWSYEVWESYWIWDPAFTSILMTWLLLTAYLHGTVMYRRGKMNLLAPALAINSYIFALYSTYIIRSGTIQSAHVFGEGTQTVPLFVCVIIISAISEGFVLYRYFTWKREEDGKRSKILSTRNTFYATIIILAALSFILFWGLASSMVLQTSGVSVSVDLYGTWSYPFTLALIFMLGICVLESLGKYWIKGIILGAALIPVFILAGPFPERYANLSASVLAFAGISSIYQIYRSSCVNGLMNRMRSAGPHIVHLGIAVMLAGVLMSAFATSETLVFMKFNEKKPAGGYEIELADLSFPVEHKHATAILTKIGVYNIYKDGIMVDSGAASFREIKGEFITQPLIYRGLLADVNIRYQGVGTMSPILISVANVRVIPGMTILWAGSILVVIGIIPLLISGRKS